MGFLTEREREVMRMLRRGMSVRSIGENYKVSDTSISRSITNTRKKISDLEDDIEFLIEVGFLKISGGKIEFISRNKDPKALAAIKNK